MTQMNLISETEIDSQTQRTDRWLPSGGKWERDGLGVGVSRRQLFIIERISPRSYCVVQGIALNILC